MIKIIKAITQRKAGFRVSDYNSSKRLSEIIYLETGIDVSYNTIRRFFGIVKSVKPSNHTLNSLAIFNGYSSYNDFVINYQLNNRWKQEFEIADLINLSNSDIYNYLKNALHKKRDFVIILVQIVRELILLKKYVLLDQIFNIPKMNFNLFHYKDVAYFGNCVGPVIKSIDIESKGGKSLITNDNFIDLVLCTYLDYNNLNSYYIDFLNCIQKNTKRTDIIELSRSVMNLNSFLSHKKNELLNTTYNNEFHPILKSRIMAQPMFFKSKDVIKILNNYHQSLSNIDKTNIDFYFEIITTSLVTQNFEVMDWISKKIKTKTNYDNFYKYEHYQHFTLMLMILLNYQNNKKLLAQWLDTVSFDNFYRPYTKLLMQFVYILKYHTTLIDRDTYRSKYLAISEHFYPSFFTEKFLLNYFKK